MKNLKSFLIIFSTFFIAACSDSNSGADSATLEKITITSTQASVKVTNDLQLTAKATYTDDTTKDVTDKVTWKSSSAAKATITEEGLITGITPGETKITAKLDDVTSSAFEITVKNVRVYVVSADNLVYLCTLNSEYVFEDCIDAGATGLNIPSAIVFNKSKTIAYITSQNNDTVIQCAVNTSTGLFSSCASTGVTGIDVPYNTLLSDDGEKAFISSSVSSSIVGCNIEPDGSFSACADTGATMLNTVSNMTFYKTATTTYIFASLISDNTVTRCEVHSNNTVDSCTGTGISVTFPYGATFNPAGTYFYSVAITSNIVNVCEVNTTNATLSGCVDTGAVGLSDPTVVTFSLNGKYAFFPNFSSNNVMACKVKSDGRFAACHAANIGIVQAQSVLFQ